jgi:hypothetical protein
MNTAAAPPGPQPSGPYGPAGPHPTGPAGPRPGAPAPAPKPVRASRQIAGLAALAALAIACGGGPRRQPPANPTPHYSTCAQAQAAGAAPLSSQSPGYRPGLDRDRDGVACEPGDLDRPDAGTVTR